MQERYLVWASYLTPAVLILPMPQREYSAFILAVLERFRYDISRFNGERVHSLTNVMTIDHNVHEAFDRLELYFEAVVSQVLHSPNQAVIYLPIPRRSWGKILMQSRLLNLPSDFSPSMILSLSRPRMLQPTPSLHLNCLCCMLLAAKLLTAQVPLST
jgi:hypothetical protein